MCFDFDELVSNYGTKTAVIVEGEKFNYDELAQYARELLKQYSFKKKYIVLIADESLLFIAQFIATHYAKRVPVVISKHDVDRIDKILLRVANQWQFITDHDNNDNDQQYNDNNYLFCGATSGTTGTPKIYQRNWQSWQRGFEICKEIYKLDEYCFLTTTSPMSTSLGMHTLLLSLYLGKAFQIFNKSSKQTSGIKTLLFTVPTYLSSGIKYELNYHNILGVMSCGGELSNQLVAKWRAQHPQIKLYELYGSSETSLVAWQLLNRGKKDGCVGQLFPDVNVSFTNNEELIVQSPYLFSGYIGDDFRNSVITDDVGTLQNNLLFIHARKSDVINHGGNKVYPSEIEKYLQKYLNEVVVFGAPNVIYGENIIVMTTTHLIDTEKLDKILANVLPAYKLPSKYISVDKIPKTDNNKISRQQILYLYEQGKIQ